MLSKIKSIFIFTIALSLFVFPVVISAQGKQQGQGSGQGVQQRLYDGDFVASPEPNLVQNKDSIQTKNAGVDTQLRVANQKMEQLMNMAGVEEGKGNQVQQLVQKQKQAQADTQQQLNKLSSRGGFMKKLIGPDYNAINDLKEQMQGNKQRIKEFQQIQTEVSNQAEEAQITETVQALVEQNTALEDQVQQEEETGSLFGWLMRMFAK